MLYPTSSKCFLQRIVTLIVRVRNRRKTRAIIYQYQEDPLVNKQQISPNMLIELDHEFELHCWSGANCFPTHC